MSDLKFWVWLSFLNLSHNDKILLIKEYESPEKIFKLNKRDLIKLPEYIRKEILNIEKRKELDKKIDVIKNENIEVISFVDERYPKRLRNIYGFPIVLYAIGNINLLNSNQIVSIVGCRNCSDYGREIAFKLAYNLSKKDIVITSRMARGIDSFAHLGAIKTNCKTIAVLGSGIDYIYPKENESIYNNLIENGGLIVSEYGPEVRPERNYFPMRNRIISGLSDITIVVEAGIRSGSIITADLALEQGKEVFAVPGNITSINSKGTNQLLKEGASILTSPDDIVNSFKNIY